MGYPLQLVAILPDKGKIEVHRVTNDKELEAALKRMWELNGGEWNIYAEVNIGYRLDDHGKPVRNREADITYIRCIAGDVDAKDGVTKQECETRVNALTPQPSFTVLTGGGEQPNFMLHEPVEATEENRAKARAAAQGLAARLGGNSQSALSTCFACRDLRIGPTRRSVRQGECQLRPR